MNDAYVVTYPDRVKSNGGSAECREPHQHGEKHLEGLNQHMGGFGQIIDQFINQLIGIPLEGPLSYVYVVLNLLALLTAPFLGEWLVGE